MISNQSKEDLYKLQKQCIHIVSKWNTKTDITSLYRELKLLPFEQMIKLELITLGYKIEKRIIPKALQNMFNIKGGEKNIDTQQGTRIYQTSKHTQIGYSTVAICADV